jgi:putative DNA primase/helicase
MKLDDFLKNIPQTADINWLFDKQTIKDAASLDPNELMIVCSELKQVFSAGDVNSWRSQVRKAQSNNPTHIQIANMYIKANKNRIIYTRGDWHIYKNGVWSKYDDFLFMQEIKALLETLEKSYGMEFSAYSARSIISFIEAELSVNESEIDSDPNLINMSNGVFHIDTRMLMPHDSKYLLTTQLPFDYDSQAEAPIWQQYLESTFVHPIEEDKPIETDNALISFLRQAVGYSLTLHTGREKTFWCIGEGSNGKGVLFHVLQKLVGQASIALDLNNLTANAYQLAMLAGKKIAFCTEADKDANMVNDGQIKALISGDEMMVRQIRERPFVLKNTAKLWWSMNNFPHVKDTSHGFWRRVMVLPFNRIFTENEAALGLKDALEAELSGIFNWAIDGLTSLEDDNWIMPKQIAQLTKRYKKESNIVELFIDDKCVLEKGKKIKSSMLYNNYKTWCETNGHQKKSSKNFKNELERLKIFSVRENSGIYYLGIELDPNHIFDVN